MATNASIRARNRQRRTFTEEGERILYEIFGRDLAPKGVAASRVPSRPPSSPGMGQGRKPSQAPARAPR